MPSTSTTHRQHARQRHAGEEQAQADEDGLDEGDADHALRNGADRRHRQHGELVAALGADDAREDRPAGACAGLAEGHDDAGDDEGGDELEDAAADAGHHAPARPWPGRRSSAAGSGSAPAGRSCAAARWRRSSSPTTGHSATPRAAAGSPACSPARRRSGCCTESPIEFSSTAVGTTISATPSSVISVAAQPLPAAHPARPAPGAADRA